jgi:hypothetical protein
VVFFIDDTHKLPPPTLTGSKRWWRRIEGLRSGRYRMRAYRA